MNKYHLMMGAVIDNGNHSDILWGEVRVTRPATRKQENTKFGDILPPIGTNS